MARASKPIIALVITLTSAAAMTGASAPGTADEWDKFPDVRIEHPLPPQDGPTILVLRTNHDPFPMTCQIIGEYANQQACEEVLLTQGNPGPGHIIFCTRDVWSPTPPTRDGLRRACETQWFWGIVGSDR